MTKDKQNPLLQLVKSRLKESVTYDDLMYLTRYHTKILSYHELRDIDDLFHTLKIFNNIIILYETNGYNDGHWCTLCLHEDKRTLLHYDSYGLQPDAELLFLNYSQDELYYSMHLQQMKIKYNLNLSINPYQHQLLAKDTNSCGRFAGLRAMFWREDHESFNKIMTSLQSKKHGNINPDNLSVLLTITNFYISHLNDDF